METRDGMDAADGMDAMGRYGRHGHAGLSHCMLPDNVSLVPPITNPRSGVSYGQMKQKPLPKAIVTMKTTLFTALLILLCAAGAQAQQQSRTERLRESIREHIREMLEEKLFSHQRTPESRADAQRFEQNAKPATGVAGEREVSGFEHPESEIHAAVNPTDTANIVITPIQEVQAGGSMGGGQLALPVYVTKDFGATWTKSPFVAGGAGGGDPVLAFDADGTLYFSWLDLRSSSGYTINLLFTKSTDGGMTWAAPDTVDGGELSMLGGTMVDKQWMAVDRSNSPRRNSLYLIYLRATMSMSSQSQGLVLRRKPAGAARFDTAMVHLTDDTFDQMQFSSVNVDAEGNVHIFFWGVRNGESGLWHRMSTDGVHFGPYHEIAPVRFPEQQGGQTQVPSNLPQRMGVMPQFAVNDYVESTGQDALYAVWNANDPAGSGAGSYNEPFHVYFSASYDHGDTWTAPHRMDDADNKNASQFHPSISVNPAGTVVVTWYDCRDASDNSSMQYYTSFSEDAGHTFTPNLRVSSAGSDVSQEGSFGIGDYDKALSTNFYAIPIWADGRTNDGNLNVYAAFVPLNSVTGVERVLPVTSDFQLHDAVPNPAASQTTISYDLKSASAITLTLYDAVGRPVRSVVRQRVEPGTHSYTFDTSALASGMYFVRLETGHGYAVRRLSVAR